MRSGIGSIAAALVLLVGSALADPFTGRYNIESIPDRDVYLSGFIDFSGAPMGTTTFKLGDSFVTGFSIVVSGPGISTLTYDSLADTFQDSYLIFDAALGAPVLVVVRDDGGRRWTASGDLDGQADGTDRIFLGLGALVIVRGWRGEEDDLSVPIARESFSTDDANPTWKLVLASGAAPVPEPGTLLLSGLAVAGAIVWRRRKHKT